MFKETLTSNFEVWYLGGRWKFGEVVLQAIGILKMCTVFLIVMDSVAFLEHINIMVLAGVESGVVRIQTSGDICVGWLVYIWSFPYLQQTSWGYTC